MMVVGGRKSRLLSLVQLKLCRVASVPLFAVASYPSLFGSADFFWEGGGGFQKSPGWVRPVLKVLIRRNTESLRSELAFQ